MLPLHEALCSLTFEVENPLIGYFCHPRYGDFEITLSLAHLRAFTFMLSCDLHFHVVSLA